MSHCVQKRVWADFLLWSTCPLCKDKNSFSLISSGTRQLLRDLSTDWTSRWVIYFPLCQLISHPALPRGPCSFIPLTTLTFGNVLPWLIFTLSHSMKTLEVASLQLIMFPRSYSELLWVQSCGSHAASWHQTVPIFNICAMMESGHGFILLYVKWNFLGVQDILSVVFSVTFKMFCFTVTNKKKVCAVKCTHRFSVLIWDLAWRVQCGLILRKQQEEACHRLVHFHTLTLIGRACTASRLQRRFCVLFLDVSSELFEICCYHWTAQSGWCELARFASEPQTN